MGILLTTIVLLGFIPPVLLKPNGAFSLPLLYHVHGIIFVSWLVSLLYKLIWLEVDDYSNTANGVDGA